MSPEQAVADIVLGLPAVIAIVGTRVYLDKLPPRGTYPSVLVQLVHEPTDYHLRGGHVQRARVQVDAYAQEGPSDPYAEVMALADAIHGDDTGSGLSGYVGNFGSPGFSVAGIFRIERVRGYEPAELRLLRQRQDYWVHFTRE